MINKTVVVIRHLSPCRPVVSFVKTQEILDKFDSEAISDLRDAAEEHIRNFKIDFPEFRTADWYVDFV